MTTHAGSQTCLACGNVNPAGVPSCENCGEALSASRPGGPTTYPEATPSPKATAKSPRRRPPPAVHSLPPVETMPSARRSSSGRLSGTVNRFESRPAGPYEIWTFQLEGIEADGRASSVLVQAGPSEMQGILHNGDRVQATGKYKEGVFHASGIISESNGAFVGPTKTLSLQRVLTPVVTLCVIGTALLIIAAFVSRAC